MPVDTPFVSISNANAPTVGEAITFIEKDELPNGFAWQVITTGSFSSFAAQVEASLDGVHWESVNSTTAQRPAGVSPNYTAVPGKFYMLRGNITQLTPSTSTPEATASLYIMI